MIFKVLKKIAIVLANGFVFFIGLILLKSKKYIIIGSWMGSRYADNSRFLFEYLSKNKKHLKIKKIIWATRSKIICDGLKKDGFDAVLIGTLASFYYHCKSKVHIICNTATSNKKFKSDIDCYLSSGAIKIQLWHGNGIKCVPGADFENNKFLLSLKVISTPGLWHPQKMLFLCKSDLDAGFFEKKFGISESNCIHAAYPRTCGASYLNNEEKELISLIGSFKKIILFLPTFRDNYLHYVHPLSNVAIINYLEKNNYLWIEKPHAADKDGETSLRVSSNNVLLLKDSFDINVLLPLCDLLVTDYSSAMLDAMFYRKQIVYYTPDFDYYIQSDRGFLMDFDSVTINPKIKDLSCLIDGLEAAFKKPHYDARSEGIRKMFWKHDGWTCEDIWREIKKKVHI